MTEQLYQQLASTGVVGVLLVLALIAVRMMYKELKEAREEHAKQLAAEKQNRIDDAKAFNGLAMALQKEVITAVTKLGEIVDAWEKREDERLRNERRAGLSR